MAFTNLTLHAKAVVRLAINHQGDRRHIFREYLFDLSRLYTPVVGVESNGVRYLLPTADKFVGKYTFASGRFLDDATLDAVDAILAKQTGRGLIGRDFLDLGANIGTTTISALKSHGVSHVWAFEPSPDNLKLLRCNLIMNDVLDDVTILPMALSDSTGTIELELSDTNWGDCRVVTTAENGLYDENNWTRITVDVGKFDDVAPEAGISLSRVGLAWMDIQGHEGRLLAGASSLLNSDVPILTEYWPYGMRRAEGLELFHGLVAKHFSSVIDLGGGKGARYDAANVATLANIYRDRDFTDLLLLR